MYSSALSSSAIAKTAFGALSAGSGLFPEQPFFSLDQMESGSAYLSSSITVNSNTLAASFRFQADAASTSTWTATNGGTNVPIGGSGSLPTTGQSTPFTKSGEQGLKLNGGQTYVAASSATYDIATATNDIIVECVFKHVVTGAEQCLFGKYTLGRGYLLVASAADVLTGYAGIATTGGPTLVDQAWYHVMVFADRNGNNRLYVNGVFIAQTANANTSESVAGLFSIGSYSAGSTSKSSQTISLVQGWFAAGGTIGSTADQDTVAANRFAQLTGVYPLVSSAPQMTCTRTSAAWLDRVIDEGTGERGLFLTGANWPRLVRRKSGSSWYSGILREPSTSNRLLYSQDQSNAAWTKSNCTATAGISDPAGGTSAYGIRPSVILGTHAFQQTVAGSTDYVSCFAKQGANQYFGIRLNSGGTDYAIFDLQNGTVASTSGSNINASIIPYGNGWYWCGCGPGGGTNQIYFVTTNSSSSLSYTELSGASDGTYIFGCVSSSSTQKGEHSYVRTTSTTASRGSEALSYSATNYAASVGAIVSQVLMPSAVCTLDRTVMEAYTDANNKHTLAVDTSNKIKATVVQSASTQVSGSGSSTQADATLHTIQASYATNDYRAGETSAEITDTSVTMPAASTLYVGDAQANTTALLGVLVSLKSYNKLRI